jgi:putative flavoprotein involved in K+ transport
MGKLPRRTVDPLSRGLRRISIPDLEPFGLPRPSAGLAEQFRRTGTVPILDTGFVEAVRSRRIEIVAAVDRFEGDDVLLADGSRIRPDSIVAATGYRPGLEPLVGHLDLLDERGLPRAHAPEPAAPGLWFIGFEPDLGGLIRRVGRDAQKLAIAVSAR